MKNAIYLLVITLLMSACSYKNEPIALQPYKANYAGAVSQAKTSIYIDSVTDTRTNKNYIGYAMEDGKKKISFFSNENFEKKYKDALLFALNIAEFNTNVSKMDATIVISLNIKEVELIKTDKSFDENLKGKISLEVIIKQGMTTTKHNFMQKEGKWIGHSHKSRDLEPFLTALFSDSIDAVVAKLAQ